MGQYHQGIFTPDNPQRYKGPNLHNIQFRSSWELILMRRFDQDPQIAFWNSESVKVPYTCPVTGRFRRYHVDFWIQKQNGDQILIEVKPHKETLPPKPEGKSKKRFIQECKTYAVNTSKWKNARAFAADHKMKFVIITENELGIR